MKRRAKLELAPLGDLIARVKAIQPPRNVDMPPLLALEWEAVVGTRVAERARPVRIERGVLQIRAATSAWAQELALLSPHILENLRARGFVVTSLRFIVGAVEPLLRPTPRTEARVEPPAAELPAAVRLAAERITDPGLRAAVEYAAAKNLGWQAMLSSKPR